MLAKEQELRALYQGFDAFEELDVSLNHGLIAPRQINYPDGQNFPIVRILAHSHFCLNLLTALV
jgi:hypothetical protein